MVSAVASWVHFLSVWILPVLSLSVWVPSGFSCFLPLSKDMNVWLIGLLRHSKLPIGVNVNVSGCLSLNIGPDLSRV